MQNLNFYFFVNYLSLPVDVRPHLSVRKPAVLHSISHLINDEKFIEKKWK